MSFKGCPHALGCTVLLKGASAEKLQQVKKVMQVRASASHWSALHTPEVGSLHSAISHCRCPKSGAAARLVTLVLAPQAVCCDQHLVGRCIHDGRLARQSPSTGSPCCMPVTPPCSP